MNFDLTKQDAELILAALAKQPYEVSHALIQKLLEQGNKQIQESEAEQPASE